MRPEAPPEGQLITAALKRARMSARAAARTAGISEARWRQITSGYQTVSGVHVPVSAPAVTLARMALAVGATAEELRAAGRDDAADELEHLSESSEPVRPDADSELDELIEQAKAQRDAGDPALYDMLMAAKRMNEARRQAPDAHVDRGGQQAG